MCVTAGCIVEVSHACRVKVRNVDCSVQRLLRCRQISLREAYKGTKKVGLSSITRKSPVSTATSHMDTSNNVSHKPAAMTTVPTTTTAAAAAASSASDRTAAAASWPQVGSFELASIVTLLFIY